MCNDLVFAFEAAQIGLRMGVDACWAGDSSASGILGSLVSFFTGNFDGGDTIGQARAGWLLDYSESHASAKENHASFIGPLGVAAKSTGDTALLDNAFRTTLDLLESPQFNRQCISSAVGLISLAEMSGNVPHIE
jgi:hypothetical protein